jgi:hypothetical protein
MSTYRAYRLDALRRIKTGRWIEAASDLEARRKASDLCEEDTSGVEIWQGSRHVDEIDCDPKG